MFQKEYTKKEKIFIFFSIYFLCMIESISYNYIKQQFPSMATNPFFVWLAMFIIATTFSSLWLFISTLLRKRFSLISKIIKVFALVIWCTSMILVTISSIWPGIL